MLFYANIRITKCSVEIKFRTLYAGLIINFTSILFDTPNTLFKGIPLTFEV